MSPPGGSRAKAWLRGAFASAVGGVLLWFVLRETDWHHLTRSMRAVSPVWILIEAVLMLVGLWARAVRWKEILRPVRSVTVYGAFSASAIGFMTNNVLPLKVGEVVRAFALSRREAVPLTSSVSSIVIDRILDGTTIAAMGLAAMFFLPLPRFVQAAAGLMAVAFLSLAPLLVWAARHRENAERIEAWLLDRLPDRFRSRASGTLGRFVEGLSVLTDVRGLVRIALWTAPIWILWVGYYAVGIWALGWTLPWYAAFVLVVIVAFAMALPSLPGAVGTFQVACVLGLKIFGVEKQDAITYAIVFHAIQYVVMTALGLLCLAGEGWGFRDILAPVSKGAAD